MKEMQDHQTPANKFPFWVIGLVILAIILLVIWLGRGFRRQPKLEPDSNLPQPTVWPTRVPPEVESAGATFEDESETYNINPSVNLSIYQKAISAAWQELVDKGFATRNPNRKEIVTIQIPAAAGSSNLVSYQVDISQQIEVKLSDRPVGFGDTPNVKVQIAVGARGQLVLTVYQSTAYDDPGLATALSIAFDSMSVIGRDDYLGPRPAITAFEEFVRSEQLEMVKIE